MTNPRHLSHKKSSQNVWPLIFVMTSVAFVGAVLVAFSLSYQPSDAADSTSSPGNGYGVGNMSDFIQVLRSSVDYSYGSDCATRSANPLDIELAGWVSDASGTIRYYDPLTHKPASGWVRDRGRRYYIDSNTGEAHIGWLRIEEGLYWLGDGIEGERGVMQAGRWVVVDGTPHYLTEAGAAAIGWVEIEGVSRCFNDDGTPHVGWALTIDGRSCWVKPDTWEMAAHEWVNIDGTFQPFDDNGTWISGDGQLPPDDESNMDTMSMRQQAVIAACDVVPWPGANLCAGWVSSVFSAAGEPSVGGNACDVYDAWCVSDDLVNLLPGMVVAVHAHPRTEAGATYGHVGIYVGNGKIRDSSRTGLRTVNLSAWRAWYGVWYPVKWGWVNDIDLSQEG